MLSSFISFIGRDREPQRDKNWINSKSSFRSYSHPWTIQTHPILNLDITYVIGYYHYFVIGYFSICAKHPLVCRSMQKPGS